MTIAASSVSYARTEPLDPVWIVRGAIVSLSPGLSCAPDGLVDADGRRYPLNGTAATIARLCAEPIAEEDLVALLRSLYPSVPDHEVRSATRVFVGDLFRRGLVSIHQSFVAELVTLARNATHFLTFALVDRRALAPGGRFPVRRYAPTRSAVVRACVEAYQPILWVGLLVTTGFLLAGFRLDTLNAALASTLPQLAWALLTYFLLIPVTAVFHELGHWYAAGHHRVRCLDVFARRGVAGVTLSPQDRRTTLRVTLAGPLAGVVVPPVAFGLYWLLGADLRIRLGIDQIGLPLAAALGTVMLMQLLSLTPVTKDGRVILRCLRGRDPHGATHGTGVDACSR